MTEVVFTSTDGPIQCGFAFPPAGPNSTNPYPSLCNVAGLTGRVNRLRVRFTDLQIDDLANFGFMLESPNGTKMNLLAGAGAISDTPLPPVTVTLSDDAAYLGNTLLVDGATYKPTQNIGTSQLDFQETTGSFLIIEKPYGNPGPDFQYTATLNDMFIKDMNPLDLQGNWKLYIRNFDKKTGEVGSMASWSLIFRLETESLVFPQNFDGVSQPFRPAAWDTRVEGTITNSFPKFISISTMWHGPVLKLDAPGISFIETPIIDVRGGAVTSFGFIIDFNLMYYLNSTDTVVIQYKDTTQSVWRNVIFLFDNSIEGTDFYLTNIPIPPSNPLADQILGFQGNSNGILNRRFRITQAKIIELGLQQINLRVSLGTTGVSSSAGVFFDDMVITNPPTVLINEGFEAGVIPPGWSTGTINSATPWDFKLPVSKPNSLYIPDLVFSISLGQGFTELITPDFTLSDLSILSFQMKWDLKAFNRISLSQSTNNGLTFSPIPIERFILNGYNVVDGWSGTTNNVFRSVKLFLPQNITNVQWTNFYLNLDSGIGAGYGVQIDNVSLSPLNNVTPTVSDSVTFENIPTISGLQINVDNENVTFFKITNITGGALFLFDGVSSVLDGDFILVEEGNEGLKFLPNSPNNGSFQVQSSVNAIDSGLVGNVVTGTIFVLPTPIVQVTDTTGFQDVPTLFGLNITVNSIHVFNFQITNISNGTLFKNDGTTLINDGDFITVLEGNIGLKFIPNSLNNGSFQAQASVTPSISGLVGELATGTIFVQDLPIVSVTDATTFQGVPTTSGLEITVDNSNVQFFQITNISNGDLFQFDGTTPIFEGAFILESEGIPGLKFTPNSLSNGSFNVQSSLNNMVSGLLGNIATATIFVENDDNPIVTVTPASTFPFIQTISGLQITVDDPNIQFFKITNITNGDLFLFDGTTPISNGDFITLSQGNDGLKFTPTVNSDGSFDVTASLTDMDDGLRGDSATGTISLLPEPITQVTNATTFIGVPTTSGLVITVNSGNVQFFQIFSIEGGTLFKNDGITQISENAFITISEGNAGLKFTPNSLNNGTFTAQASVFNNNTGLVGSLGIATIFVQRRPIPCLHPNSLVKIDNVYKKISEVKSGDSVHTSNGIVKVEYNMKLASANDFIRIEKGCLGNGLPLNNILIRADHPIMYKGVETNPKNLIKKVKGIRRHFTKKPVNVWSIVTKNREFIDIEGIPVCTWCVSDKKLLKYDCIRY
jgi:hypothetical protein